MVSRRFERLAGGLAGVVGAVLLAACSREVATDLSPSDSIGLSVLGADNRGASIAANGRTVVVTWAATTARGTDIYTAASTDAGRTFAPPVRVNDIEGDARVTGEQPPRVAVGKNIAVAWESKANGLARVRMATSGDGGRTFTPATSVHGNDVTGARGWASVAMDRDGTAHVVWLDARPDEAGAKTTLPGKSRSGAAEAAAHVHEGREPMEQSVFYTNAATAEARVARGACFCCKTGLAVAPDRTVYLAWRHVYPTNLRDIAVARSTDDGRTFSEPVRVSEDHWQIEGCPEDGPAIAVDSDGVVHIAWPTFVRGKKGVFYSYSTDGGRTFAPRARVDTDEGVAAAHPQIAVTGSRVVVVWDESVAEVQRVRSRAFVADAGRRVWTPERSASIVSAGDVAEYPAVAFAGDAQIVAWSSGSEIRVRTQ